jgi:hypothetical protein
MPIGFPFFRASGALALHRLRRFRFCACRRLSTGKKKENFFTFS